MNSFIRTVLVCSVVIVSLALCAESAIGIPKGASVEAPTQSLNIPDDGWHLWLDRTAQWRNEPAYLPEAQHDIDVSRLQPHPPSGGWDALSTTASKVVSLPTTVEQHFWGVGGLRPYKNEYFYESRDSAPRNGNYIGVSWWYRAVNVPGAFAGKTAILHIRAAKQIAEVYVNRALVGYQFIGETSFDCDVTSTIKPGSVNTIAIRIINPGGRLDWGDWDALSLGNVGFFAGHAFGGLDRGITLSAHGPIRFTDSWVLNTPDPHTVTAHATLQGNGPVHGRVAISVIDTVTRKAIASASQIVDVPASGEATVSIPITVQNARLWDLEHPNLYRMRFAWGGPSTDERTTTFGFRWFGPSGVGSNAVLRLNGSRIRVYSAISWGFYGINGLWPTPTLAEKEVHTAKSLGMNAINFHRNIARTESLDAADRLGLLRYTEPGGGMTLFWDKTHTDTTLQRYMVDKIARMVRDHRSHPSLMVYVIQNELDDTTSSHPLAPVVLRMIHAEDPSRAAILKSGLGFKGQMWMMPYDDTLYSDKGDGVSGWWDEHTVGTPDSWVDANYQGPEQYVYRNTNRREIVDYGEMGGSGTADNHALMLRQIQAMGGASYDLIDHQEIDAAYNRFLDQYGFRTSFPTTEALYQQIGEKQYDYWAHVLQCARLSDETDYLTVSGWETTAVENHSGIVDVLRNPHGDPRTIQDALRPVMPDLQVRTTALVSGETSTYDLTFLNESNHPQSGHIDVTLQGPDGRTQELGHYPVPAYAPDVFVYRIATGLVTPKLDAPGRYVLTAAFSETRQSRVLHVVKFDAPQKQTVAVAGASPQLLDDLNAIGQPTVPFVAGHPYGVAVCAPLPQGARTTSDTPVSNTTDPELYKAQRYGKEGMAFRISGLPEGLAKVTLGFDEAYFDHPGARLFDIKVNGVTVQKNVDVYALSGGKDRVWTITIETQISDGTVLIEPGTVAADNAMFSTIRVDAVETPPGQATTPTHPHKIVAVYFGDKPYTAKDGVVWTPYVAPVELPQGILNQVPGGMGLLVLAEQDSDITGYAKELEAAGVFHFGGLVGNSFAPWMGSWYIVRHHPLYTGLPQDTVMQSDYQVSVGNSNGVIATGPGVEWVTAYSRDHSRVIGAGDVVAKLGKGRIVFHVVPRMNTPFQRKWLCNALAYLSGHAESQ